jgi:pilus assembly protein CpaE
MDSGLGYEEALRSVERIDTTFAGTAFSHHSSNLALLGVTSGTLLSPHDPTALLARLRSVFPLTLCDTGGLPIQHIPPALLKQASEIWLVTDQAIGSLVSIHQTLRELEQRGLRGHELHLLVNRYDPGTGISDEQIAQRFELPLLTTLPERSRSLRSSIGLGRLLTDSSPRDPYVRALAPLLQRLDRRQPSSTPASPVSRLANLLSRESWKKN